MPNKRIGDDKTRRMDTRVTKVRRAENKQGYTYADDLEEDYDYERSARVANIGCLVAFAAVFLAIAGILLGVYLYINGEIDGNHATAQGTVAFDVPAGSGGQSVAALLYDAGLIGNESIFRFYVRFNGAGSGFQQGRFNLEPGMSYGEIIEMLSQPPPPRETVWVTIPEGSTVYQFGQKMEEANLCTADAFVQATKEYDYSTLPFFELIDTDPDTFLKAEGYLAPNTYEFYADETVENILAKLFDQFNTEIMDEEIQARMQEQGLSLRQVITLASLIEEEAGLPENQPGVAGVFWNRLVGDLSGTGLGRRTMGSDVTYYYLRDWVARDYGGVYENIPQNYIYAYLCLDEGDLREGLPVGPLSCPSKTAIQAALYPERHNYYYFLTDFYGTYYYAETYAEHERNIATMNRMNEQYEAENGAQEAA